MPTKLEKHLSRLAAPAEPLDLKARCLSTIPFEGAAHRATPQKKLSLLMRPIAVASVLMFAAIVGVAFWSTRPPRDGVSRSSGSVAFADVLEASRHVSSFHAKGCETIPGGAEDKLKEEVWYDASKGRYSQALTLHPRSIQESLPPGVTPYSRTLVLPDGTVYYRETKSSQVFVGGTPNNWKAATEPVLKILTGSATGTKDLSGAMFGQVLSSTTGEWKGQEVQILVLERQPSPSDAAHGRGPIQAQLYVNPSTKLVIALRDFAKSEEGELKLMREYEFDYSSPSPELFDPKSIEQGATIRPIVGNKIIP